MAKYVIVAFTLLVGCTPDRGACYAMVNSYYSDQLYRACRNHPGKLESCPDFERLLAEHAAADARCKR